MVVRCSYVLTALLSATKKSESSDSGFFLYVRRTGPARTDGPDKKAGAAQPPHFSPVAGASPARGPFPRYLPAAGFIRTTRVTSYTPAYCAAKPSSEGPASTASSSASTSAPHFSPPVTRSYSAASTPVRSTTQ